MWQVVSEFASTLFVIAVFHTVFHFWRTGRRWWSNRSSDATPTSPTVKLGRAVFRTPAFIALVVIGMLVVFSMAGGWEKEWRWDFWGMGVIDGWPLAVGAAVVVGVCAVVFGYTLAVLPVLVWVGYRRLGSPWYFQAYRHRHLLLRVLGNSGVVLMTLAALVVARDCGREGACEAATERGRQAVNANFPDAAIALLDEAIRLKPYRTAAYFQKARALTLKGETAAAIAEYTKVIELNGEDSGAYLNRGLLRKQTGSLRAAVADFSKAIELDATFIHSYLQRGKCQLDLKNYGAAIDDCTKAIEMDRTSALAFGLRSKAYSEIGERAKASEDQAEFWRLNKPADALK